MSNLPGIVAPMDNITPLYNKDGRWTNWGMHEIYLGDYGENKHVPKVGDWVTEIETGDTYRVVGLDPISYIPDLQSVQFRNNTYTDVLLSVADDSFRIYYDKSVVPFTLAVDSFMHIHSNTASYARVYRGTLVEDTKVISRRYDSNGKFLGTDIPLEMVAFNSHDNYGVKSIPVCSTNVELVDGEACLVIVFDNNGKVISKAVAVVEETTYIRQSFAEHKYITNVYMKSAFIDDMNSKDVYYPVNLPMTSFSPIGVVQYNDGSQLEYPIDGSKFTLHGLDSMVSGIIGHKNKLVLSYLLGNNEAALADTNYDGKYITKPYEMTITEPNNSYDVKLFVYPVWIDQIAGYTYKAYLMNLNRNVLFDVTNVIGISPTSSAFNGLLYGVIQRVTFSLNLKDVSGGFNDFLFSQSVDLVVRSRANDDTSSNWWEVWTETPSQGLPYGTGLRADLDPSSNKKVRIDNGLTDVDEWLELTYYRSKPLVVPVMETEAPRPTHIQVQNGGDSIFMKVEDFEDQIEFSNPMRKYGNIEIVYMKETVTGYLSLGIVSMTVR